MNRPIKFRFWCISENRYVNDPAIHENGEVTCADGIAGTDNCTGDVIPLQWTGCHDKNKTEIYEGDKILYRGRVGRVEFFAGMFQVAWDDQTDDPLAFMFIDDMEVVGKAF